MLKKLIVAAVILPLAVPAALAGGGGCNWSKKEDTVAQSAIPAPAPAVTAQTPVPQSSESAKVDVAQAPVPATAAMPKAN